MKDTKDRRVEKVGRLSTWDHQATHPLALLVSVGHTSIHTSHVEGAQSSNGCFR